MDLEGLKTKIFKTKPIQQNVSQIPEEQWEACMQRTMDGEVVRINSYSHKEKSRTDYLANLSEFDRLHVLHFLGFIMGLQTMFPDTDIAVIAVGSSTKPKTKRKDPINDLDFRILNSEATNSNTRQSIIACIQTAIHGYLEENQIPFDYSENTRTINHVTGWVDWYNNDPSFITKQDQGLPLHISVSGLNNPPLRKYLRKEKFHRTSSVILLH